MERIVVQLKSKPWSKEKKVKEELFFQINRIKNMIRHLNGNVCLTIDGMPRGDCDLDDYCPQIKTLFVEFPRDENPVGFYLKTFLTLCWYPLFVKTYQGEDKIVIGGEKTVIEAVKENLKKLGFAKV